ncbi:MAG: HlyC/CorC family transporter [Chloroflexi bacterium]|nr:HlyC/CorC family transporter [Chloroflexota bacterium]
MMYLANGIYDAHGLETCQVWMVSMNPAILDLSLLGLAALLILANAFFVAAEFALVSVRRTRIEELVAQGNATARTVKHVVHDPDRFIAATQLGITIASLALGWIGEPAVAHLIEPLFGFVPESFVSRATAAALSTVVAFALITFLHVVIGELAPKSVALSFPEQSSLVVAPPMVLFENIFRPAIWALNGTGNWLLKLVGLNRPTGHQLVHSVEELKMLLSASTASGELEPVERAFAERAFNFADRQVGEIMIPRTALSAVEDTANLQDFLELFAQVSHSRFPVYNGTLDNIVGFVWVKDVLRAMAKGPSAREQPITNIMRTALYVPTTKEIGELFSEMQKQKAQLAIVLDEYGGTAGMVTIEELIEQVVGRVSDELATNAPSVRRVDDAQIEADAMLRVDEANEQLNIALPESDDYETLAGLLLTRMGRVPKEGDATRFGNLKLTVTKMRGPKIEKILITRLNEKK